MIVSALRAQPTVAAKAPFKKTTIKKTASKKAAPKKAGAAGRELWFPGVEAPAYLDGSLPGDVGFDPFSLSAPTEFLQFDLDALDQSRAINKSGNIIGKLKKVDNAPTARTIVPYNEAFDIIRFRECELLHGRWSMLAILGVVIAEANTGITWIDAGKVELEQPQYLGAPIGLSVTALTVIEVILMGYLEIARSSELDQEKRIYPGGYFDPFGLADASDADRVFALRTMEVKHSRLAMVAMFGITIQAGVTGTTSPITNLFTIG